MENGSALLAFVVGGACFGRERRQDLLVPDEVRKRLELRYGFRQISTLVFIQYFLINILDLTHSYVVGL